ncbi:MAG: hypothetical protein GY801_24165, partial [bacterium]|nr:hypothetical protein [bacterium]
YAISDTAMLALDERSGTELFSFPLGASGGITTQVAIADGMLYFCRHS